MNPQGIDYAADQARFNPKHRHAFLLFVERRGAFKLLWLRTAASYADILGCFEAGREQLKNCRRRAKRRPCPSCGGWNAISNLIEIWYYVVTRDDVLFERHCRVRSIDRAVERIEPAVTRLRKLVEDELKCCSLCGRTGRIG